MLLVLIWNQSERHRPRAGSYRGAMWSEGLSAVFEGSVGARWRAMLLVLMWLQGQEHRPRAGRCRGGGALELFAGGFVHAGQHRGGGGVEGTGHVVAQA